MARAMSPEGAKEMRPGGHPLSPLPGLNLRRKEVSFDNLRPGMTAERTITVEPQHTVSHTKTPVLSTPVMISMMENVAKDLTQEFLTTAFTTVGYEVNIKHKAPAALGTEVKVWTRLLEAAGRKLLFEVRVSQGEKVIGEGLHRRTIIQIPE
jgi:predicted thioesterase